jgi:MSHA biogenesis protein MshJ
MKALQQRWLPFANRIDAASLRERVMIFAAATLVLITLINSLLITPLLAKQKQRAQEIIQIQQTTAQLQTQTQAIIQAGTVDPDLALQARLNQLQQQTTASSKTLDDIQSKLIAPQQMPALLEDLLRSNKDVHMVALNTLPITELTDSKADTKPESKADDKLPHIYRHGIELTISGKYIALTHYLSALEALPWRMFWGQAAMTVDEDGVVQLKLRLYTLSQDKTWLSI